MSSALSNRLRKVFVQKRKNGKHRTHCPSLEVACVGQNALGHGSPTGSPQKGVLTMAHVCACVKPKMGDFSSDSLQNPQKGFPSKQDNQSLVMNRIKSAYPPFQLHFGSPCSSSLKRGLRATQKYQQVKEDSVQATNEALGEVPICSALGQCGALQLVVYLSDLGAGGRQRAVTPRVGDPTHFRMCLNTL